MSRRQGLFWLATVTVSLVLIGPTESFAQGSRGVSRRPTISPYLNMFRRDLGISARDLGYLDPYLGFSRPSAPPSRDYTPIQSLGTPSAELLRARAQAQQPAMVGGVAPTGTGSVFMNHSHYYPRTPGPATGRRR